MPLYDGYDNIYRMHEGNKDSLPVPTVLRETFTVIRATKKKKKEPVWFLLFVVAYFLQPGVPSACRADRP